MTDPITKGRRELGVIFWAIVVLYWTVVIVSAIANAWH